MVEAATAIPAPTSDRAGCGPRSTAPRQGSLSTGRRLRGASGTRPCKRSSRRRAAPKGVSVAVAVVALFALLILSPVAVAAQMFWQLPETVGTSNGGGGCWPHRVLVPALDEGRAIRVDAFIAPPSEGASISFYDGNGTTFGGDLSRGGDGHLRAFGWARRGPAQSLWVCIGLYPRGSQRQLTYEVQATYAGLWPDRTHPTAAEWTDYNDRMYRELIFDDYDAPGQLASTVSSIRANPTPRFYIELGGPNGCENGNWRLSVETLHFWRAIVPMLAEMITGIPYPYPIEAGCRSIPVGERQGHWHDLVVVSYVTPGEYRAETGKEWGEAAGRAALGGGRIWINNGGYWAPDERHRDLIAHEIGHSFGLRHTSGRGEMMNPSTRGSFPFLTRAEEDAARRAYEAGYESRYCGDPRKCGNGKAASEPPLSFREPPIVVD